MDRNAHVPQLFVLAGTNGAGKSSVGGATIRARGGEYFNPDEASARIRREQPYLSTTQANSAAWHEGKRLLQHAIAHGLDYNFETTLGGSSFARLIAQAADNGYEVRIWYVGLATPELHLARVRARVKKGGHDIPEADIRRRFDHSRVQLIALLPHLTELRLYDNSFEADPHRGERPQPRLVLHFMHDETGPNLLAPHAGSLGETPEWAKPIVAAAIKLGALQPSPAKPSRTAKPSETAKKARSAPSRKNAPPKKGRR